MCGIAGVLSFDGRPASVNELRSVAELLAHRGPDGEGFFVDGPLGLAHRRLAVIDPEAGAQPMSSNDERYVIVFNGEIYNFLELRHELEQAGRRFKTNSDTEVILEAFSVWGADCQSKFNGMWSFAIWDRVSRALFLSRDRFGVKPLHYFFDGKIFAFSSELKGFLGFPWFQLDWNPDITRMALVDFTMVDAAQDTLLSNVHRLMPGECILIDAATSGLNKRRWWRTLIELREMAPIATDLLTQIEQFQDCFIDACRIRMRSDVPLGTALSGGFDSSAVHCAMGWLNRQSVTTERRPNDWMKAFVAGFKGTPQDETPFAKAVVNHVGSEPMLRECDPRQIADHVDDIVFHMEAGCSNPPSAWLLYRQMREAGIVVSMDGHGGDELLAGYHQQVTYAAETASDPGDRALYLRTLTDMTSAGHEISHQPTFTPHQYARPLTRPVHCPAMDEDRRIIDQCGPPMPHWNAMDFRLYTDFSHRSLPNILQNFDRLSMASGVEIRAPFMDWRLVLFCMALPLNRKIQEGYTKYLARLALAKLMPRDIVKRKAKIGFVTPMAEWIVGPLRDLVFDHISSRAFQEHPDWDGSGLRLAAVRALATGDGASARQVWPFLQVHILQQQFASRRADALSRY